MKKIIVILLPLLFSACGLTPLTRPSNLTPEEMQAYKDIGFDVYSCFKISGPPAGGGLTILTVPTGTKLKLSYYGNCDLLKAETENVNG